MEQIFTKIKDYDNYAISNDGVVLNIKTGQIKKTYLLNTNYHCIDLYSNNKRKKFLIHRLVADNYIDNPSNKSVVDHIDGNHLNNNVNNLRWATIQENNINSKIPVTNTSGHKGVYYDKERNKWSARISINNKSKTIGRYKTKEEAIEARKNFVNNLYNEYVHESEKI